MNRSVKKAIVFLALAALVISIIPKMEVSASSGGHVSISVTPKELAQAGTVTVSISLTNTNSASQPSPEPTEPPIDTTPQPPITTPSPAPGENPSSGMNGRSALGYYTNIKIANSYGASFSTDGVMVAPGAQKVFTAPLNVTDSMIGVDLSFTVSWDDGGTPKSETVTCKVNRKSSSAYLSVSRTASPVNAMEGTEVTFRYTFTNTGSTTLVNITLVDRNVFGTTNPATTISSLAPGQSKEFTKVLRMGTSTIVSAPVVTYYTQGGSTPFVINVSQLTVGLIQSQLTKEIVMSNPTPEGVQFTIYLTNNGNQKLSNLIVTDELGNNISGAAFSLAVGEQKVIRHFVSNPSSVRYVVFKITGTDFNGTAFKDSTSSYAVRPYIDTSLLGLTFTAGTTTSMSLNSVIGVEFNIKNTGSLEFYNLSVSEKSIGYELHKWDSLPVGASDKVEAEINIGDVRDLVFELKAEDSSGNTYTYEAYVNADQIDVSHLVPPNDPSSGNSEITVEDDGTGLGKKLDGLITSTGHKLMTWFKVLGFIAGAAAIAIIALGISEIVIRRNKRSAQK